MTQGAGEQRKPFDTLNRVITLGFIEQGRMRNVMQSLTALTMQILAESGKSRQNSLYIRPVYLALKLYQLRKLN